VPAFLIVVGAYCAVRFSRQHYIATFTEGKLREIIGLTLALALWPIIRGILTRKVSNSVVAACGAAICLSWSFGREANLAQAASDSIFLSAPLIAVSVLDTVLPVYVVACAIVMFSLHVMAGHLSNNFEIAERLDSAAMWSIAPIGIWYVSYRMRKAPEVQKQQAGTH
jgi:hypothetical protein